MKKFLKDLEAELKKFKISDEEIKEILADHKEMLTEATNEGLTDEEIELKFGAPQKLAKELYNDVFEENTTKKVEPVYGTENLKDYELIKSFPVLEDLKVVNVSLVSEDIMYFPFEGESIEVYAKGRFNEDDYTIDFNEGTFNLLNSRSSNGFRIFGKKTPDFAVRVPKANLDSFKLNLVSGDGEIEDINASEIDFKTVSGDIEAKNIVTSSELKISVVSGDAELLAVNAKGLEITMVSGDLELMQASFDEDMYINTVSGDVEAKDVRVNSIDFHSVSGDFEGREVYCNEVSLKSVSGDMVIDNDNKEHKVEVKNKKSLSGKVTIK